MSEHNPTPTDPTPKLDDRSDAEIRYAAFAFRLGAREWGGVIGVVLVFAFLVPVLWKRVEMFETSQDYRIPYELSKDYWLYQRRLSDLPNDPAIVVIGDSVVWGEYVTADGTLSHFLNQQSQGEEEFINAGVNGLFPLALEGLVRFYGSSIKDRRVILHCNLLWLSSPKADLSIAKEEKFNHPRLVPQWTPEIPCYRASVDERLGICIEREVSILQWGNHLQNAYFDQKDLYNWTLADDGNYPPRYPNAYKNPLTHIRLRVPTELDPDPVRGLSSARHKPWSTTGVGTQNFEWVALDDSLQWQAFKRLVDLLEERENEVLIVMGPFNQHIMTAENADIFQRLESGAVHELGQGRAVLVPKTLTSELYGDASHPLTEGYRQMAVGIYGGSEFQKWLSFVGKGG